MNYTIWRYPLEITDRQTIKVPVGARLMCVKEELGILTTFWFVDPQKEQQETEATFYIYITGHPIPYKYIRHYVDSVVCNNGRLVWHIFCDYKWGM